MWTLPPPLDVSYAPRARPLHTADVTRDATADVLQQRIVHAPLHGVTREMLFWWMHHIGDRVEWEGFRGLAYRLWHPRDHIHWSCDGPVRAGARFHIVEAFARKRRFLVDKIFDVPRLDDRGFRIETRFAGIVLLSVDEQWEDVPGGVRWTNTMRLAARNGALRPIVRLGRRLARPMLSAWLTHNVEEVGYIPHFLPTLFRRLTGP